MKIAAVKNRFGPHAADGSMSVSLAVDYANCQITEVGESPYVVKKFDQQSILH
jgi:hypothetical protein